MRQAILFWIEIKKYERGSSIHLLCLVVVTQLTCSVCPFMAFVGAIRTSKRYERFFSPRQHVIQFSNQYRMMVDSFDILLRLFEQCIINYNYTIEQMNTKFISNVLQTTLHISDLVTKVIQAHTTVQGPPSIRSLIGTIDEDALYCVHTLACDAFRYQW